MFWLELAQGKLVVTRLCLERAFELLRVIVSKQILALYCNR